jgi:hypothetical protein
MAKGSPYLLDRRLATEPGDSAAYPYDRVEENRIFEERAVAANMSVQGVKLNDWASRIVSLEGGGGSGPSGDAVVFNTLTDVGTNSIAADVDFIVVGGYAAAGDCPPIPLKRVASEPAHEGKKQSADGAWWEFSSTGGVVYLEWFGGKGDYWVTPSDILSASTVNPSPTDNLAAFVAADRFVAAYTELINPVGRQFSAGPTIQFGYGGYYFSDEIVPTAGVCLQGMGTGVYHYGANSRLYFAAGKTGIVLNNASHLFQGTNGTAIRNLYLESLGFGGQTTKHGIRMDAAASLEHVTVRGFGGSGIDITADVGVYTNANLFYMAHIATYGNAVDGITCEGGDANAGVGIAINASSNGRYGINDSSFLGNTWIACHADGNPTHQYYMAGVNARSVCIGCYMEGGTSYFGPKAANFGGYMIGSSFTSGSLALAENGIYEHYWYSDLDSITVRNRRGANNVQEIAGTDGSLFNYRWNASYLGLVMQMQETGFWPYFIASMNCAFTCGRDDTVLGGTFHAPMGIFLNGDYHGNGVEGRFLGYNKASGWTFASLVRMPGMYAPGDTLIAISPSTEWGYVCTVAGGYTNAWSVAGDYGSLETDRPDRRYVRNSAGRYYKCTAYGPGAPADEPVHTSGSVTGADGYTWQWLTNTSAVFKRTGALMGDLTTVVDDPIFSTTQTWNDGAVTFRGHKTNITSTASAAASMLEDWQVSSSTQANIRKDGRIAAVASTAHVAGGAQALQFGTTTGFGIWSGSGAPTVSAGQGSLYLRSDGSSTSTRMYVNQNGSTTWTAVTTAA